MHCPESVTFSIKRTANQLKRLMAVRHSHHPGAMTGMQHAVIGYVGDREEPVFQRDIERFFNIRRSTATGILQLMERNALIRRESVEHDMRLKRIVLTGKALVAHCRAVAEMDEIERSITQGIPSDDLGAFFRTINRIGENIEGVLAESEAARPISEGSEDTV